MGALWQDVRYALRVLLKSPGFTATAILTLALGIGANSTIFSWINSTLLNPIPGAASTGNILAFTSGGNSRTPIPFSYPDFLDLRERTKSFSALTAFSIEPMNLTGKAKPERTWGTLEIKEHPYSIVGVAPPIFQGTQTGLRSELWLPIVMAPQVMSNSDRLNERGNTWAVPLGRVQAGVTLEQAQSEMNLLMKQLVAQYPKEHQGENNVTLYPLWRAPFGAHGCLFVFFSILMPIAGAVLLLACANVANLLLVRSVARRREIAIRLSIGASRWRLVRQLLIESLILALAGGGVAMLITIWTAGTFAQFIPPTNIPVSLDIHADHRVLLGTMLLSLVTGIIFGVLPAWRASDLAPIAVLKEDSGSVSGGLHRARLASILVVAQISLSLFLLVCAGLFIRSFRAAQTLNPGFNPDRVLLASYSLFPMGY